MLNHGTFYGSIEEEIDGDQFVARFHPDKGKSDDSLDLECEIVLKESYAAIARKHLAPNTGRLWVAAEGSFTTPAGATGSPKIVIRANKLYGDDGFELK